MGRNLLLINFSAPEGLFLFFAAASSSNISIRGIGFYIARSNYVISIAGCCPIPVTSELDVEAKEALIVALHDAKECNLTVQHIFVASQDL